MKAFFIHLILFLSAFLAYGQQRTITGTVTDASDGTTIPAVTVLVKGTTRGTTTDLNGFYSLKVNETDKTLVFSFMGKKTLEVALGKSSVINASLESADVSLDEVVVVGYGTMKKSDLTGSVASIRTDDLKKIPVNSFDQGIQGKVSGV